MSDKANATCIALEARVVQPLLLWEPYTLIDSLGHTDLFVSVLFTAIPAFAAICPSYASASIVSLFTSIRIDTNLYVRLPLALIARPRIIPCRASPIPSGGPLSSLAQILSAAPSVTPVFNDKDEYRTA